jgi:hypothetical protein
MIGDKRNTEALGVICIRWRGRGAFSGRRSGRATDRGVLRREDADISNDKTGEIPVRRKPEVSRATFFVPGLVGT